MSIKVEEIKTLVVNPMGFKSVNYFKMQDQMNERLSEAGFDLSKSVAIHPEPTTLNMVYSQVQIKEYPEFNDALDNFLERRFPLDGKRPNLKDDGYSVDDIMSGAYDFNGGTRIQEPLKYPTTVRTSCTPPPNYVGLDLSKMTQQSKFKRKITLCKSRSTSDEMCTLTAQHKGLHFNGGNGYWN